MKLSDKAEQILHFGLLGVLGGLLLGPLAIPLYLIRELSRWKWMPWPFKGQWPPGYPHRYVRADYFKRSEAFSVECTQMDRVEDLRRDLISTLMGYAVGQTAQIGGVIQWFLL